MLYTPPTAKFAEYWLNPFKTAATSIAVEPIVAAVNDISELESVVAAQAREPNSGPIVMPIALRSLRWRLAIVSPPSMRTNSSSYSAAY
jgi:putative tryptophan/tyrosine transport system substrate-binding protein